MDFTYLEGFAAGDVTVINEVLTLFRQQAETWAPRLQPADPGWRDLLHTIKGAGRGIGAAALGDLCEQAEAQGASGLPAVRAALAATVADIAAYQGCA